MNAKKFNYEFSGVIAHITQKPGQTKIDAIKDELKRHAQVGRICGCGDCFCCKARRQLSKLK